MIVHTTELCKTVDMENENPDLDHVFASRIAQRRERLKLSKTDLARKMQDAGWDSYSQMTVTRTENEERKVGVAEAHTLAEVLDTSYDDLIRRGREQELTERSRKFRIETVGLSGKLGVTLQAQHEFAGLLDEEAEEVPPAVESTVDAVLSWNLLDFLLGELTEYLEGLESDEERFGELSVRQAEIRDRLADQHLYLHGDSANIDGGEYGVD